jgi:N-acetylglucosaminyl-diphospho-decaprenol L-rhamnosyltransferase
MTAPVPVDVSLVIINLNEARLLQDCLRSIRPATHSLRLQIIVVDNGSKDDSVEVARREWPDATVLAQGTNIGYVRANNRAIPHVTGRYFLYLNNDTLLEPNCLETLVRFMDEHPEAGAISPMILNADGTDQGTARNFPTPASALFGRRSLFTRVFPNNRWSQRYMVGWQRSGNEPFEVEFLSTACMLMRTADVKRLGGFDEAFRHYWVDAEYCARVRELGLKVYCVPGASMVHFEGQGGSTKTFRKRLKSNLAFHLDARLAYMKVYRLDPWDPRCILASSLLLGRAVLLTVVQILRPKRAVSSGHTRGPQRSSRPISPVDAIKNNGPG